MVEREAAIAVHEKESQVRFPTASWIWAVSVVIHLMSQPSVIDFWRFGDTLFFRTSVIDCRRFVG